MEKERRLSAKSRVMEQENMRKYDEKSGLWYLVYWDDVLKCYVSQLAPGQKPVISIAE